MPILQGLPQMELTFLLLTHCTRSAAYGQCSSTTATAHLCKCIRFRTSRVLNRGISSMRTPIADFMYAQTQFVFGILHLLVSLIKTFQKTVKVTASLKTAPPSGEHMVVE